MGPGRMIYIHDVISFSVHRDNTHTAQRTIQTRIVRAAKFTARTHMFTFTQLPYARGGGGSGGVISGQPSDANARQLQRATSMRQPAQIGCRRQPLPHLL